MAGEPPSTKSILELPNETLTAIFSHLPASSLCNLSCVQYHFKAVAERLLYSSISISDLITEYSSTPARTLRCCESLLQRPYLFDTVKRIFIRWQATRFSNPSANAFLSACERLRVVLLQVPCIEFLELSLGPANAQLSGSHQLQPLHAIERVIHGCVLPQLQYCSLGADGRHPYTTIIQSFLSSAPSIRTLRLLDVSTQLDLPSDALPNLATFRGTPTTAASVISGRPVFSLSLACQDSDVTRDKLPELIHTTLPIRILDLSAISIRPLHLNHISKYFPTLHMLRMRLTWSHTLHYNYPAFVSAPVHYLPYDEVHTEAGRCMDTGDLGGSDGCSRRVL